MKTQTLRLAVLSAIVASFAVAAQPGILTNKEAKTLIMTAKTAKDHQKLARYYTNEAVKADAEAKDHDEMMAAYRQSPSPTPQDSKAPGGVGTIAHCESLAKSNREMAVTYRAMAAGHEAMAKEAGK